MLITWYDTAAVSLITHSSGILFDPFIPFPSSETKIEAGCFGRFDDILITHGHFDHIVSLSDPVFAGKKIFCSKTPANTLKELGIEEKRITVISPGTELIFGDIKVTVFRSKHVSFDLKLIMKTLFSCGIFKLLKNINKIKECIKYKENDETVGYLVEGEEKRVFVLGSLALDPDETYPDDIDVLVLPYQGSSKLKEKALDIIDQLKPRAVMLDHFDDSFPPISSHIDTSDIQREGNMICSIKKPVSGENYCIFENWKEHNQTDIIIKEVEPDCDDARKMIGELNESLTMITGRDGSAEFKISDFKMNDAAFLIAYSGNIPKGCGGLKRHDENTAEFRRIYAQKNTIGIGSVILGRLEKKAKELGYSKAILGTMNANSNAVYFYYKNGYRVCENYGRYKGNEKALCFEKKL